MPAMLDDPDSPTIYRVSGALPYPDPAHPSVPETIIPRHVTLRDRQTVATVVPFASRHQVPESLLRYLGDQFNKEIEGGDTYPMMDTLPFDKFASYWFQNFAGIMLLGNIQSAEEVVDGKDWSKECLGTFYIKPNYPGRSSHVCNAGFIVTDASRNRGVGRLMGETYLDWAPRLGYIYSVFNLVYETNVASCKIWDALGFKRIGRVKSCGNLKSYPDRLVDAIIFGRDLGDGAGGVGSEELVSEERFDKIKFYLKYGRYPNGADRAEKSRLRSAATHYKLLDGDVLMLKDKEVISDPQRQYEIARRVHNQAHAGINKTTATIAERYHWSRIKETVSDVIRNCTECKELGKTSSSQAQQPVSSTVTNGVKRPNLNVSAGASSSKRSSPSPSAPGPTTTTTIDGVQPRPLPISSLTDTSSLSPFTVSSHSQYSEAGNDMPISYPSPTHHPQDIPPLTYPPPSPHLGDTTMSNQQQHHQQHHLHSLPSLPDPHAVSVFQPIDPQIISQPISSDPHAHALHHHHHSHHYPFDHASPSSHHHHDHHHHTHDPDADTFQALLNAADDDGDVDVGVDVNVNVVNPDDPDRHETHPGLHSHHPHHHPSQSHHNHSNSNHNDPQQQQTAHDSNQQRTREEVEAERAAVDRDLEMLIEPQDDDDDDDVVGHECGGGVAAAGADEAMDVDVVVAGGGGGGGNGGDGVVVAPSDTLDVNMSNHTTTNTGNGGNDNTKPPLASVKNAMTNLRSVAHMDANMDGHNGSNNSNNDTPDGAKNETKKDDDNNTNNNNNGNNNNDNIYARCTLTNKKMIYDVGL